MLLFGHVGITLGAAAVSGAIIEHINLISSNKQSKRKFVLNLGQEGLNSKSPRKNNSWADFLGKRLDIRFFLVGSLLPDLIDKPIGLFFFRQTFENGRIFSHTVLFLLMLILAGLLIFRLRRSTVILGLVPGTFTHLILDQMWEMPHTLLWPLFGLTFERTDTSNWAWDILGRLLSSPAIYVPETIGIAIVFWFLFLLFRTKAFSNIIKHGRFQSAR